MMEKIFDNISSQQELIEKNMKSRIEILSDNMKSVNSLRDYEIPEMFA